MRASASRDAGRDGSVDFSAGAFRMPKRERYLMLLPRAFLRSASSALCFLAHGLWGHAYLSPSDLAWIQPGRVLAVTHDTGRRLDLYDAVERKTLRQIPLPDRPRGLAYGGGVAWIPTGVGPGKLHPVDPVSGNVGNAIAVGHGPMAPVLAPDGKTLFICNRFDNSVSIVDLARKVQVKTVPVVREPVAAVLTPDGKKLFVANHLPLGPANLDYVAAMVSVIDAVNGALLTNIPLVNGSEGLRGICVSPDGQHVYATHLMARYQVPTTQLERGWVSTDALSIIRTSDNSLLYTVLLDDVDRGFANPWGVAVAGDGKNLFVSSAGNGELGILNLAALFPKIEKTLRALGPGAEAMHLHAHNDLAMLSGIRERLPIPGKGARNLITHGDRVYVAEYFSDSLAVATVKEGSPTQVESVALGPRLPLTPVRRGEMAFNDAGLCFQNWLSCASCHPDARTDGINWDLLNDGIGNLKNVKSLFLAHETPPSMALGIRSNAALAVRTGMRHIQFMEPPPEEAEAISIYLSNIEPSPSPFLVDGRLSAAAERGKATFQALGCAQCHPAPLYTDLRQYEVGTGTGQDVGKKFDTPTLRELWRTAPYLHDGRYATLVAFLEKDDHAGVSNRIRGFIEAARRELAEFLLSL
jgi:YVTN family beta-propeller protein